MAQAERSLRLSARGVSPNPLTGERRKIAARFTPIISRNKRRNCFSKPSALNECVRRNNTFQWCNSFLASLKQAHERQQVPPGWRQLETGWRSTEKVRAAFHKLQRSVGEAGAASGEPAQERSARRRAAAAVREGS